MHYWINRPGDYYVINFCDFDVIDEEGRKININAT